MADPSFTQTFTQLLKARFPVLYLETYEEQSALHRIAAIAGDADAFLTAVREHRPDVTIVDVRLLLTPGQWPVQLTAFLFGMSVLGAQIPLSTFARTDPDVAGEMLQPSFSGGVPEIDDGVYEHVRQLFEAERAHKAKERAEKAAQADEKER